MLYLDEGGFQPEYPILLAWTPCGKVVYGERPLTRPPRQNLLAARNCQEFLVPMIVSGSITAIVFETWLKEHLCPMLSPRALLILDNARFHRPEAVTEMAEAAGHHVLFLPPYSPDFNKLSMTLPP